MRFALPFLLFNVIALQAQESINSASVSGRVLDPSRTAIMDAAITAKQTETNFSASTHTDRDGRFRFAFLPIGPYEVSVRKDGFAEVSQRLRLSVGGAFDLPISLAIGVVGQTVQVSEATTVIEASRSEIAGTVTQAEVDSLPLNGRNFLDLALLVPGVSPTNTASNQLFAETSAVPGQGISVGSQRNFSNNFIVDGLSANDDAAGLSGIFYGLDTIHEFQVVTSGGQAEFGRALGGYISAAIRGGTNTMHGTLYGFGRNQRFNAANPLSNTKLPSTQAQYGASVGGPIKQDRTFYFGNFERRELNQSGLITIAPANVAAINARLMAVGYPGSPISTGLYPNPVHSTNFLAKLDHKFSDKDRFTARYSLYDVGSKASRGAGALSAVSASAGLDNTDQTVAVSNVLMVSSRTVNETRAQYTRSNLTALPTDPIGPAVSISGVASFGTLSGSPTGRVNNLYEAVDSISHQAGAHALRAGVDFLYNDLTITFPRSIRGAYTFSSLNNFLAGTYNNSGYTQTFGNTVVPQTNPNVGFFAQDEWKVNPSLTVNLGLRYDLQFLKTISTDTNNISPRAGFAWTPFASRRTVVRGGYGLYYDRIPLRALANALLSSGNTTAATSASQLSVSLSPGQAGAPLFPNILPSTGLPAGVLVNYTTMNRNMQNAYSVQGNFEIEQQIGSSATFSVAYEHLRGIHLIASVNQNVPSCVAAGTNNGCRPNPAFGNDSEYSPAADSRYDGLHVTFVQRPVKWGSYRISYTFSKALDDVGEFFFSAPMDNFNIWRDYGRSDDDQRHRFVLDGNAHARGFELSGTLQYYSSLPLNVTSGVTTIQGTAGRPFGRNTGVGNDLFTMNLRASRTFHVTERWKLQALVEGFNVLNHRNNLTKNGTFGPSLGQVTAVNDSRVLQAALRATF